MKRIRIDSGRVVLEYTPGAKRSGWSAAVDGHYVARLVPLTSAFGVRAALFLRMRDGGASR